MADRKRKLDEEGYSTVGADDTNALIQSGPTKKKNHEGNKIVTASGQKLDLKKSKKLKELKEKKEAKLTKNKKRELKRLAERKQERKTRAELIASLQEVQLSAVELNAIKPTAERKPKKGTEQAKLAAKFPKKLRATSGKYVEKNTPVTSVHYDTGSSDEDDVTECEGDREEGDKTVEKHINGSIQSTSNMQQNKPVEVKVVTRLEQEKMEELRLIKDKRSKEMTYLKLLASIKGEKVVVDRVPEMEKQRSMLPIYSDEQMLVEEINDNNVTIVSGETGSGKTTQIPQFLYEAGYTSKGHLIAVTEPRRVAAMSMSERVGSELNNVDVSSYQIRFEGNRTNKTKILFMTDGVLLKELQADPQLRKFSVVVIDEAHERSMYSDVLIGLLSRISVQRAKNGVPLKLVIMSATLRISDFMQSRLFPTQLPKLISVEARQFPVTVHFEKKTPEDYIAAAFLKVCKIHDRLPEGGVLVFVSGQKEVHRLIKLLQHKYPARKETTNHNQDSDEEADRLFEKTIEVGALDDFDAADCDEDEEDGDQTDLFQVDSVKPPANSSSTPLHCLPLFSMMPSFAQHRVFEPPPANHRLCVVSTNVAETSLTIPNIRYVVDTGKEKRRDFDPVSGVSQFNVCWTSQASASQRSGRAGRVAAGHAYRLYSSAVFEEFSKFPPPEILHKPVDQVVLQLKAMNIKKIANFPFPTPPESDQISKAEDKLKRLGALRQPEGFQASEITALGKTILNFPLAPHLGKMIVISNQHGVMPYVVSLVSTLTVREPMVSVASLEGSDNVETQELMVMLLKQRREWNKCGQARRFGDLNVLMRALMQADRIQLTRNMCVRVGLRFESVKEIRKIRRQLTHTINQNLKLKEPLALDPNLEPPSETQIKVIRQILISCQTDQIARKVTGRGIPKGAYQTQSLEELVFIDPTSTLYNDDPDFVQYQEIIQIDGVKKMQMVSEVDPEWMTTIAKEVKFPLMPHKTK